MEAAQQVGALVLGEVVDVLEQQHQVEGGRWQLEGADVAVADVEPLGQAGVGQPLASKAEDGGVQVDPSPVSWGPPAVAAWTR